MYLAWYASLTVIFVLQTDSNDLMQQAQLFIYANGNNNPPTAIDLDKSLLRDLLFNQSPAKVSYFLLATNKLLSETVLQA